jgi:hypothetical protein
MLGHHPQIAFLGELEWIWDHIDEGRGSSMADYYEWLKTHRHFRAHGLRIDRSLAFDDLVRAFLKQMRASTDPNSQRDHVGCQVHRHYARALAVWPRARFIHIVRDGRDVCASWIKFGWIGNAYEGGANWRDAMDEWATVKARIDATRRIELRFEDLLRAPRQELERLCEFLRVPYSDAMLRYHEDTSYEPIDASKIGSGYRQLGSRGVRLFEAVAAEALAAHGYPPSGELPYSLTPWSRPLLSLDNKLRHHAARARLLGLRLWLADILARRLGVRALRERVRLALNDIENARLQ